MKLAKLSLAAMVVAGLASSSFAADNLADAFKNGKVSGELKAWYFDKDTGVSNPTITNASVPSGAGNASIFNTGVVLGYVTDSLYGLSLGATFQSNYSPFADDEAKNLFGKEQYGSGAVLSEAYLAYTIGKTTAKVGRQYISTPLVSGSGSRMIKESFEGATVVNTDIPATTLIAGYVSKFQARTTASLSVGTGADSVSIDETEAPKFTKTAVVTAGTGSAAGASGSIGKAGTVFTFDGAYTVAAINKSIPNLALTAQYAQINEVAKLADVDLYYTEANYVLPMSGFKLGFDAQFRGSKTDSALDAYNLEGHYTAGRISISELAGFGASFAYATTSKNDAVIAGVGNGPTGYTATLIRSISASLDKDTDSYLAQLTYDFGAVGVAGLKALAQYGQSKQHQADTVNAAKTIITPRDIDFTSKALGLSYDIPALKGLTLAVQYESQEKDTKTVSAVDTDEFRFMANYKF